MGNTMTGMRKALLPLLVGLALVALAACEGDNSDDGGPVTPPPGRIAFTSDRDGNEEIYLMNADGTEQTNLTRNPAWDNDPWWSPDGSEIAFASTRDGQVDLYVMSVETGEVRRLTNTPEVDGGLRWSPDGSRVALYSFASQRDGLLWVADPEIRNPFPVLASIHPAGPEVQCAGGFPGGWFLDGQRILFRGSYAAEHALQICSVNADGTDIRVIFSEPETESFSPSLSPDGERIAFVSNRDGNYEIYVMDADGKNLQRVTRDSGTDIDPVWSPDGQWLAFASDRDGDFEIYIVQVDGSGLRQLTENDADDLKPAWSPS